MNLNEIITDNLAVEIDLNDPNSWNLNTGLTTHSLTKWSKAASDNIDLIDFGLTGFDIGRTNEMWNGITITPQDTTFSMHRVGYNTVKNPTSGETSGMTINTSFLPVSGITDNESGNYFELDGGYLQGFFKLDGYKYDILPSRYNNGITIETLIYLYPDSEGIFYMMGARAEDKYNPYFTGETTIKDDNASGVITSQNNHLEAVEEKEVLKNAFADYEDRLKTELEQSPQSSNINNNVIAFEITPDKKIGYKYIDENNQVITNKSKKSISPSTGWTTISLAFTPNSIIEDSDMLDCYPQREGKFIIYINGRPIWVMDDYPEFFFNAFKNDPEKQIGVPYSISWGGGSFGLKHSWHYDIQTYGLYDGNNQTYINEKFTVEDNPYDDPMPISGLSLNVDDSTFDSTVMSVEYTGGTSAQTYFIKYDQPIVVLSNREYEINLDLYIEDFLKTYDIDNEFVENNISIVVYGSEDIDILSEDHYKFPLTYGELDSLPEIETHPFADDQEYSYVYDGVSYYGITGLPVYDDPDYYLFYGVNPAAKLTINTKLVTGQNRWLPLQTKFKLKDNTGKQIVYVGILIETSDSFNINEPLFIRDFTYTGADILSQDPRKDNLLIEQNFNSSLNGRLQKLRIYDKGLTSQEILHNSIMESEKNPNLNLKINKGGRIIYR